MKFNPDVFKMPARKSLLLKLADGNYAVGYGCFQDGMQPEGVEATYDMSSVKFSGKIVGWLLIEEENK